MRTKSPQNAAYAVAERRSVSRLELFLEGSVELPDGRTASCTVKNVSSRGALLLFANQMVMPNNFILRIPDRDFYVVCLIRHFDAETVGVEFISNRKDAQLCFSSPYRPSIERQRKEYKARRYRRSQLLSLAE